MRDGSAALALDDIRKDQRRIWLVQRSGVRVDRPGYERAKRLLDLGISLLILPGVLVLLSVSAVLIWVGDRGPIFFVQERTGRGGRRFRMLKLRTMVADAAEQKDQLAHLNRLNGPDFKIRDDPRVTTVGRFLRKTSLDELPQIFNVLRGEMSLVGPRPTSFEAESYDLWHTERLEVVPGVTGIWQISGRSEVDFDERVRLDIEYIERRGFALDLSILVRTVLAVINGRGAY